MKYKWYKWRQYTSSRVSEWKYILLDEGYIGNQNAIKELLDNRGSLCTWSEHFRRVEVKPAYNVPSEVLIQLRDNEQAKIKECEGKLKWLYSYNNLYAHKKIQGYKNT